MACVFPSPCAPHVRQDSQLPSTNHAAGAGETGRQNEGPGEPSPVCSWPARTGRRPRPPPCVPASGGTAAPAPQAPSGESGRIPPEGAPRAGGSRGREVRAAVLRAVAPEPAPPRTPPASRWLREEPWDSCQEAKGTSGTWAPQGREGNAALVSLRRGVEGGRFAGPTSQEAGARPRTDRSRVGMRSRRQVRGCGDSGPPLRRAGGRGPGPAPRGEEGAEPTQAGHGTAPGRALPPPQTQGGARSAGGTCRGSQDPTSPGWAGGDPRVRAGDG